MFSNLEFQSNQVHQIDKLVNLSKTMPLGYMLIHIDIEGEGVIYPKYSIAMSDNQQMLDLLNSMLHLNKISVD